VKLMIPLNVPDDIDLSLKEIEHMTQLPRDEILRLFLESVLVDVWESKRARVAAKTRFAQIFPETARTWALDVIFSEGIIRKTVPPGRRAA